MGIGEHGESIALRMSQGGSLAEVKREIIDPSSLDETQRDALMLYAATLARRAERKEDFRRPR